MARDIRARIRRWNTSTTETLVSTATASNMIGSGSRTALFPASRAIELRCLQGQICKASLAQPRKAICSLMTRGYRSHRRSTGISPPLGSVINYRNWIPGSVNALSQSPAHRLLSARCGFERQRWIGSDTGQFGGAGKRLQTIVGEIEANGFAFLAHPVEDPEPGSIKGPDVVPYSDVALTRAWSSPAILGLQFWNENDRYLAQPPSSPNSRGGKKAFSGAYVTGVSYNYRWPFPGYFPERTLALATNRTARSRHHGDDIHQAPPRCGRVGPILTQGS